MDGNQQKRIDEIYKNLPLGRIPWNSETPPQQLVELIDTGKVSPCKVIDLGCGAGNCAIYLAECGFDVTGVDFSPTAVKLAKQNAKTKDVQCNFLVADVLELVELPKKTYDFAYDWGLLHHIFPHHRQQYIQNLSRILNPKANYLSVCFSEKDTGFGGSGKYRKTKLGSTLYFSSEDELRRLFERHFHIIDLQTSEIKGRFESHIFNYAFMEKR